MFPRLFMICIVIIVSLCLPDLAAEDNVESRAETRDIAPAGQKKFCQFVEYSIPRADSSAEDNEKAERLSAEAQKLHEEDRNFEAIDRLNQSIELRPQLATYMLRASVWGRLEEYPPAIDDCNNAIELDADYAWGYAMRGYYYAHVKDFNRAIVDTTRAVEMKGWDAEPLVVRAMVWNCLGHKELAAADLTEAIQREPSRIDIVKARAVCWNSLEKWNQLLEDAEKIVLAEPEDFGGYLFRASARTGTGEYHLAKQDYLKAISIDKTDPAPRRHYSHFLASCPDEKLRDVDEALELATSVCEQTKWQDFKALSEVAFAYYALGQFDEAVKHQTDAIKLALEEDKLEGEQWLKVYEARAPMKFNSKQLR